VRQKPTIAPVISTLDADGGKGLRKNRGGKKTPSYHQRGLGRGEKSREYGRRILLLENTVERAKIPNMEKRKRGRVIRRSSVTIVEQSQRGFER